MGNKNWVVFTILIMIVIVASGVTALYSSGDEMGTTNQLNSKTNNILSLKEPPFLIASAQEMGAMDAQTCSLEDEAGISAYWNVGSEINLNMAREAYKSIDTETDEYIIGIVQSVEIPSLVEIYPRVYTRKDGWILAYIPKGYSEGGIFQRREANYVTRTTLYNAIRYVCAVANVNQPSSHGMTYYNFQQPEAEEMLVISERAYSGSNKFNYTIQTGVTIYNGSYSLFKGDGSSNLYIDNDLIATANDSYSYGFNYGYLNSTHLEKDSTHTVRLESPSGNGYSHIILFYTI
ncbi:hypothetical protein C5S31_05265 [ANME-1 cluster archaeon GoMg2]|nr:hypothetical protein [ANME-1 cluster archaeon GoMg2]